MAVPIGCGAYDPEIDDPIAMSNVEDSNVEPLEEETVEMGSELLGCGVHFPAEPTRYDFNGTNHGFRIDSIFEVGTNERIEDHSRGTVSFLGRLWFGLNSSEQVIVTEPSEQGYTFVDLVSREPVGWEDFHVYRFSALSQFVPLTPSPVFAQLRIVGEKCNGTVSHFVGISGRSPTFCELRQDTFRTCTADLGADWFERLEVNRIREVRVRLYLPPVNADNSRFITVDGLEPFR